MSQAAETLKTLAHPVRMRIVLLLTEHKSVKVSMLQDALSVEQSMLSHHLIKMKDRGLLTSTRQGTEIYYSLANGIYTEVIKLLLASLNRQ